MVALSTTLVVLCVLLCAALQICIGSMWCISSGCYGGVSAWPLQPTHFSCPSCSGLLPFWEWMKRWVCDGNHRGNSLPSPILISENLIPSRWYRILRSQRKNKLTSINPDQCGVGIILSRRIILFSIQITKIIFFGYLQKIKFHLNFVWKLDPDFKIHVQRGWQLSLLETLGRTSPAVSPHLAKSMQKQAVSCSTRCLGMRFQRFYALIRFYMKSTAGDLTVDFDFLFLVVDFSWFPCCLRSFVFGRRWFLLEGRFWGTICFTSCLAVSSLSSRIRMGEYR